MILFGSWPRADIVGIPMKVVLIVDVGRILMAIVIILQMFM
jgi:hypothetical protein